MESPYKRKLIKEKKTGEGEKERRARTRNIEIAAILALAAGVGIFGYSFIHRMFISPPVNAAVERQDDLVKKGDHIQVNVLNASGEHDLARKAMDYLRNRGFDVVEIANYQSVEPRSFVIDRTGDSLSARKAAFAMGIADSSIRKEVDRSLYLDASVVLGSDYRQLKPWK